MAIFEILLISSIKALPIHISLQNGVNENYAISVEEWCNESWESLGKMFGLFPTRPVYLMVAKGDFGPERGFAVSYPDSFRVLVELDFPPQLHATVSHEMMHVFQFAWMKRYKKMMPLWVMEGLATWYGGKNGTYVSPLGSDPFLFWNVDVLTYSTYPSNTAARGEYYSEVYSLFNAIDAKCSLERSLKKILNDVKSGATWQKAFSKAMGENFHTFYNDWRKKNLLLISLKFASFWGIWTGLPILLLVLFFLKKGKEKRENAEDDITKLEDVYGKDYWKGDDT